MQRLAVVLRWAIVLLRKWIKLLTIHPLFEQMNQIMKTPQLNSADRTREHQWTDLSSQLFCLLCKTGRKHFFFYSCNVWCANYVNSCVYKYSWTLIVCHLWKLMLPSSGKNNLLQYQYTMDTLHKRYNAVFLKFFDRSAFGVI